MQFVWYALVPDVFAVGCVDVFNLAVFFLHFLAGKVPFVQIGPLLVSEFDPIVSVANAKVLCVLHAYIFNRFHGK